MSTVSLVTGANRGIGLEVCRQLAAAGHDVVLTARSAEAAAAVARAIGAAPLRLDVTDPASVDEAAAAVQDRYGRLEVLINNAAISYDTWQWATTADLAVVREAGSLTSMGGGTPAYAASKAALNALTRMLAAELRPERFLVNAVSPGWVATDMGGARFRGERGD